MKAYAILGSALLLPLAAGCGGGTSAQADAAAGQVATLGANDVAVARTVDLQAGVPLSGALEPKVKVDVGAPLAEQLVEVFVDEGDAVRQGQPLARFRDDVLRVAAASARADVATGRSQVTVAVAESTRAEALFAEGAIARRDLDNARVGLELARARQALAEAQLASAEDRLATATLRAPVAGVVSRRHAQAGDRVDFGNPVVSIVNTAVLELAASVEARWLPDLRVGRLVRLTLASDGARDTIRGRVARINPTADAATRQVLIYVDVPNRGNLVGGLFVSGVVVTGEARGVVAVPRAAIRTEGEARESVVYVVAAGHVSRRVVSTGLEDAARALVQVRSGVAAGEAVVVGPIEGLADGARVDIAGGADRPPSTPPAR